jgi:hypothetical protein
MLHEQKITVHRLEAGVVRVDQGFTDIGGRDAAPLESVRPRFT